MSQTDSFRTLAEGTVEFLLAADPIRATGLGDHRNDHLLPDLSREAVAGRVRQIDDHVAELDAVDDVELDITDVADLEILRAALMRTRFELDDLRRYEWDPMGWNPGNAVYLLVSREFAPAAERAASLRGRLALIPDHLATAQAQLTDMSAIHVETTIAQLAGTCALLDGEARALAADDALVDGAIAEVEAFSSWLGARLPEATRSPRLGAHLYAGALWHALDDGLAPDDLLADARSQLALIGEQLAEVASAYMNVVGGADHDVIREALDHVATHAQVTDATHLPLMAGALERTTAFVRGRDLVGVPDTEVRIIDMPEVHRGVAVAYCDAPGPLEAGDVATYVAVAPTPRGWSEDRVASFYREYNAVQLHDLAIHEGMPGHVLQLAHGRSLASPTRVRRFGRSGVFVEGWAVYAEELMVERGYAPEDSALSALAMRLQQLKMQARGAINAILDIGVHAHDLPQEEALCLMREAGFQEEGEAVGKWRRALLTSAQLPTYFAGYRAVSGIVADLRVLHADWSDRRIHDLVLSHGSPSPRQLRLLLGL